MKTILAIVATAALCCFGWFADVRDSLAAPDAKAARESAFYCDAQALDPARRTRHFDVLMPELRAKRLDVRELTDGYEFDFPSDPETLRNLAEWIDGERECCPFFDIVMRVAPEHGAITLRLTGRKGTKEFIQQDGAAWIKPVKPRAARSNDGWIGRHAPDFRLESLDGGTISLAELRGKVVLVNFWATWCGPCKVEMPWLDALQRRYRNAGLAVVGISVDDADPARIRDFVRTRDVAYPIAMKNASVVEAYGGARYLPQTFIVGRDGAIVSRMLGILDRDRFDAEVARAIAAPRAPA